MHTQSLSQLPPQLQQMLHKLEQLPPTRLVEIEDFIDFIHQRDQETQYRNDYAAASESAFNNVWDTNDDAAYDNL